MMEQTALNMNLDNNIQTIMVTPQELQQMIEQSIAKVSMGPIYKGGNILFTDFAELWFNSRKDVRPTTLAKNRINYDKHIKPVLEGKTLSQVNVPTLQGLLDSLNLKPATLKLVKSVLNMIMTWADAQWLIEKNPVQFVKIPQVESDHKRSLTKEEIARLFAVTKDDKLGIIPPLCIATGMRPGELLGLKWDNVDFKNSCIYISETFTLDCYSKAHVGEPKTKGSKRYIAIDGNIINLLKEHKAKQTSHYGNKTYVLSNRHEDKQINPSTLRAKINMWKRKADIPDLCGYMFRHTSATLAYEAGVPLLPIARQFGHATTKLLETTYIHQTTTQDQRECAEAVSKAIF